MIGVFGLGKTGRSVLGALERCGLDYVCCDDNGGDHPNARPLQDWSDLDLIIVSPGVPPSHPVYAKADALSVEIICDIEFFARQNPNVKIIGVTGTNGKSTTVAMISHVLDKAGIDHALGGNFGAPVFDLPENDLYVLELSSYQLALSPTLSADIAVFLNISEDHLDWHGSFEKYRAAKTEWLARARHVIDVSDKIVAEQNRTAVLRVCLELGISETQIETALQSYAGLPHRAQLVAQKDGISFINDSKATNCVAAAQSLSAHQKIYWIVGGRDKGDSRDSLAPYLKAVECAYVIGESAQSWQGWLSKQGVPVKNALELKRAVTDAYQDAKVKGEGVILLAPAAASLDQFTSFEARGTLFINLVNELINTP